MPTTSESSRPPPRCAAPCFGEGLYHLSCYVGDLGIAKTECLMAFEGACRPAGCSGCEMRLAVCTHRCCGVGTPAYSHPSYVMLPSALPHSLTLAEANPACPVSIDYMGNGTRTAATSLPSTTSPLWCVICVACVRACLRVLVQERACVSATRSQFLPCFPSVHACPDARTCPTHHRSATRATRPSLRRPTRRARPS
jgi:hypothetical protein